MDSSSFYVDPEDEIVRVAVPHCLKAVILWKSGEGYYLAYGKVTDDCVEFQSYGKEFDAIADDTIKSIYRGGLYDKVIIIDANKRAIYDRRVENVQPGVPCELNDKCEVYDIWKEYAHFVFEEIANDTYQMLEQKPVMSYEARQRFIKEIAVKLQRDWEEKYHVVPKKEILPE